MEGPNRGLAAGRRGRLLQKDRLDDTGFVRHFRLLRPRRSLQFTRPRPEYPGAGRLCGQATERSAPGALLAGKIIRSTVPLPGALSTSTSPPTARSVSRI